MREIKRTEYLEFLKTHSEIEVDGKRVVMYKSSQIELFEPRNFKLENTTVWSFENRGKWATHKGDYPANWPPEIPRNLLLRYTQPGDIVLDQMVGSGTTLIEAKLLNRNGLGVDINYEALMVAYNRIDFVPANKTIQRLFLGDARNLDLIEDETVDLVATHPPYLNIIKFSKNRKEGDLSSIRSLDKFTFALREIAKESYRVLKPGKHCAILIGDTHKHKHYVPLSFRLLDVFLDVGFILREQVIKRQWHTETMRGRWRASRDYGFLLTLHEHLFVFRKPLDVNDFKKFKESTKWR